MEGRALLATAQLKYKLLFAAIKTPYAIFIKKDLTRRSKSVRAKSEMSKIF